MNLSRRKLIVLGITSIATASLHDAKRSFAFRSPPSDAIHLIDTKIVSWKPPLYHGWPTLCRRRDGELLLAFSGGREKHVCPFGRLEWMRSKDQGETWGWPQVLNDGPIDDRDAGVVETAQGSILVTTFTSLAYEPILDRAIKAKPGEPVRSATQSLSMNGWQSMVGFPPSNDDQNSGHICCVPRTEVSPGRLAIEFRSTVRTVPLSFGEVDCFFQEKRSTATIESESASHQMMA